MKALSLLILLAISPAWAAGVGGSTPCWVLLGQEGPADDIFVDTSGSQPEIYLSLQGVARQVDPTLAIDDVARLKRERENCAAAMPSIVPLNIRVPQNSARPLSRWVLADFNNDGRKDSVSVSANGYSLQPGVANRGFAAPNPPTLSPVAYTYDSATAGDVNGDGKQDLLICCTSRGPDAKLLVLLGNGNGTFAAPVESVPASAFGLTDWNKDGKLDVIALTPASTLTISLGRGDGTFQLQRTEPIPFGQSLAIVDATADSIADVIVLDPRHITVYPGLADGSFGVRYTTDLFWNQAFTFSAADFTGDGKLDLAITHQFGMTELWRGNPPGGFIQTGLIPNPQLTRTLAIDLDDAGSAELLLPGAGLTGIQIVPVNSIGTPLGSSLYANPGSTTVYPAYLPERTAAAVADFNQDGKADVAMITGTTDGASLRIFSTTGPLAALPITIPNFSNVSIFQLTALDINTDGLTDLVGLDSESQSILTFRNVSGQLTAPVLTSLSTPPHHILFADFNNDTRLDIALALGSSLPNSGRIEVRYNLGNGTFGNAQSIPTPVTPYKLAAADFNGDFKKDLVYLPVSPNGSTPAGIVMNRVDNVFQAPVALNLPSYSNLGTNLSLGDIKTADINFDGWSDVVIGAPFTSTGGLIVFLGNGNGSFQALPLDTNVAANIADITILDIDEDGKLDMLAAHCCGDTATRLYYGRGDGTFAKAHIRPTGSHADRVWLADVTGDGKPELIARTYSGMTVTPFFVEKQLTISSSASGVGPTLAVDSLASAYGTGLAREALAATSTTQLEIVGTSVSIVDSQGKVVMAPMSYASPGQINFFIPPGLATGPARVTIQAGVTSTVAFADINLTRVAPGLFIVGTQLVAANVIRVKANGQQIAELPFVADPGIRAVPIDLGPAGETVVLVLYATGLRARNGLSDVSVTIGGINAPVAYAGAQPEYPGLDQVNVTIPRSLAGKGSVEVLLKVEGQTANAGRILIQ